MSVSLLGVPHLCGLSRLSKLPFFFPPPCVHISVWRSKRQQLVSGHRSKGTVCMRYQQEGRLECVHRGAGARVECQRVGSLANEPEEVTGVGARYPGPDPGAMGVGRSLSGGRSKLTRENGVGVLTTGWLLEGHTSVQLTDQFLSLSRREALRKSKQGSISDVGHLYAQVPGNPVPSYWMGLF